MPATLSWQDLPKLAGVTLLYPLLAWATLLLIDGNNVLGYLWIATGVALVIVLFGGMRYLPALFLGALSGHLLIGFPPALALAVALRHTASVALGIWLLRLDRRFDPALRTLGDYLRILALAVVVGLFAATAMQTLGLLIAPSLAGTWSFDQRWTGHILGILIVMPLVLVWRRLPREWASPRAAAEAALILGLSFLVGQVVFLDWLHDSLGQIARGYWMFLFVTWAAVRLGPYGTVLILAAVAVQGLAGALEGTGFFSNDIANTHLANYFFYMLCLSATGMALATYFVEGQDKARTIRQYQQHLEELVRERTGELERANAGLVKARDAAEEANRAKSVFLSNMSHELRTPLNAVLGFSQLMEHDARLPEDVHRNLRTINHAGHHLLSLINDVLEISRIEAGRIAVHNEPFNLDETLTVVEEMIRARADVKGLALTVERRGDLPRYCVGDPHHLRQVLINLLGNAVKFTDRGRIGLSVTTVEELTGFQNLSGLSSRIRFQVTDTGPGIAPEEQTRVFDPFYQTEAAQARGEGTGLGLTISRELVHLMGGDLSLESAPGQGTVFSFELPLPVAEALPEAQRRGRVIGLAQGAPAWRILVAEDHPDNRDLITRLLGDLGLEVRTVENGREAVEAFQSWRPHLIWMDMRMPVMDGYAAARRIRELPGGREAHIVALTASAFREDRAAILAAGCEELVHKPIDEERLFDVMGRLLGIEFRYEDEGPSPNAAPNADLTALPAELRHPLIQAAEQLDEAGCLAIAERVRADHPDLADQIAGLVHEFRFDRIIALCEGMESPAQEHVTDLAKL